MSFTGDDAREIRIRFIEAVDVVQDRLRQAPRRCCGTGCIGLTRFCTVELVGICADE